MEPDKSGALPGAQRRSLWDRLKALFAATDKCPHGEPDCHYRDLCAHCAEDRAFRGP